MYVRVCTCVCTYCACVVCVLCVCVVCVCVVCAAAAAKRTSHIVPVHCNTQAMTRCYVVKIKNPYTLNQNLFFVS